jgi:hypothetical protein
MNNKCINEYPIIFVVIKHFYVQSTINQTGSITHKYYLKYKELNQMQHKKGVFFQKKRVHFSIHSSSIFI